jgi:hypothetical protein
MDGISFPLSLWLKVDAYSRVGLIGLVLFIALVSCCSLRLGGCLLYLFFIIVILYSLFSLAWTIVGAILFWGKLNPAGYCTGGIQIYMYIFLILSFVGICCTCVGQLTQRKQLNNRY